jgi:hypothetical protein
MQEQTNKKPKRCCIHVFNNSRKWIEFDLCFFFSKYLKNRSL